MNKIYPQKNMNQERELFSCTKTRKMALEVTGRRLLRDVFLFCSSDSKYLNMWPVVQG